MDRPKRGKLILTACILTIALASAILMVISLRDGSKGSQNAVVDSKAEEWELDKESSLKPGDISIPGYGTMVMKAGKKEQKVDMGNPAENDCYFRISLFLEDGTCLFRSDMIEPGKGFHTIELKETLKEGTYPAVIQYDCYSFDEEREPLNGAESGFMLDVRG